MEGRNKNELAAVTEAAPAENKPVNSSKASAGWASDERRFKVFISYSRRDSAAYAERLVEALEARELAARLDTRDLEFGEKWQQQLKDFIRQADAVVFIVSPKSIESTLPRATEAARRNTVPQISPQAL
jgi:hypothetical protein